MPLTATPAEMVPVQCRNAESQTWGINLDKQKAERCFE
jgi:hypothetical protein